MAILLNCVKFYNRQHLWEYISCKDLSVSVQHFLTSYVIQFHLTFEPLLVGLLVVSVHCCIFGHAGSSWCGSYEGGMVQQLISTDRCSDMISKLCVYPCAIALRAEAQAQNAPRQPSAGDSSSSQAMAKCIISAQRQSVYSSGERLAKLCTTSKTFKSNAALMLIQPPNPANQCKQTKC